MKILFLLFAFFSTFSFAQIFESNQPVDIVPYDSLFPYVNSGLYFGKPNTTYPKISIANHPFYETLQYVSGSVQYRGQQYAGIALRYDIVKQELQIKPPTDKNLFPITLFSYLVKSFSINGRYFEVKLTTDGTSKFYEKKSSNLNFQVWVSHQKGVQEKYAEKNKVYNLFTYTKQCYVQRDTEMQLIESEKELYAYFPSQTEQIAQMIKPYSRKQRKNPDILLIFLNRLHLTFLESKSAVE